VLSIYATLAWHTAHPGAVIGLLELSGITQPKSSPRLDERKRETEARLRDLYQEYTRKDFSVHPVMAAYGRYYRRFNKTYHVQLQVESIVLKNKSLPDVCPLVDAVFISELKTFVLTSGHDAAKLKAPVLIDVSQEGEQIMQMKGAAKDIRAGDMIMRDRDGISCSILYGQDNRSPISSETSHVLYVAYAPTGVPLEAVETQLQGIEANIRLFSPNAVVEQHTLLSA
jgi:DNA/RNA-binding domain of Phe-tRNA-synthetase-like protein